jgi:hypothetical protein
MGLFLGTRKAVSEKKKVRLKSTTSSRSCVYVVDPISISVVPLVIMGIRVFVVMVTGLFDLIHGLVSQGWFGNETKHPNNR